MKNVFKTFCLSSPGLSALNSIFPQCISYPMSTKPQICISHYQLVSAIWHSFFSYSLPTCHSLLAIHWWKSTNRHWDWQREAHTELWFFGPLSAEIIRQLGKKKPKPTNNLNDDTHRLVIYYLKLKDYYFEKFKASLLGISPHRCCQETIIRYSRESEELPQPRGGMQLDTLHFYLGVSLGRKRYQELGERGWRAGPAPSSALSSGRDCNPCGDNLPPLQGPLSCCLWFILSGAFYIPSV